MIRKSPEQRIAIFPGSFNPFTTGHMSIVERGLLLFDRVVVAIGYNPAKSDQCDIDSRMQAIAAIAARHPGMEVTSYDGLTVDEAKRVGARFILRGVRSVADFEYERNMADINRNISGIETVLLYALPELSSISSSMVRELRHFGHDTDRFIP